MNKIQDYVIEIRVNKLISNRPWKFKDIYNIDLDLYVVPKGNLKSYYNANATGFISENKEALLY